MFTMKVTARNGNVVRQESITSRDNEGAGDDVRIPGIEHTNEMVLGQQRISKSSGRLWMSGMQKSLKRMSVTESYDLQGGTYSTHNNDVMSPLKRNGHVKHIEDSDDSDDLDDVREYIFDTAEEFTEENSSSYNNNKTKRMSGYIVDDSDIDLYDDSLSSHDNDSRTDVLFCSHL